MTEKYTITQYIDLFKEEGILSEETLVDIDGNYSKNKLVKYISDDSRDIKKGCLFICKGAGFKKEYLDSAFEKGAVCYVADTLLDPCVPHIIVKDIRKAMALAANMFYEEPWGAFPLIGLTGTKGKSTTLYMLKSIFESWDQCGKGKFGYLSTINTFDGKEEYESHLTTPEPIELARTLANMRDAGVKLAAMEVSSQALKYDRTYGVNFDVAVFMNFSKDHIGEGEHTDIEDYFQSKLKIFKQCRFALINRDTDRYDEVFDAAFKAENIEHILTFSTKRNDTMYYSDDVRKEGTKTLFGMPGVGDVELNIPGLFNVENATAAAAVALLMGVDPDTICEGLKNARADGRMEVFGRAQDGAVCIVDYAHNKLSYEKLYESCKEEFPDFYTETIFGCPGGKGLSRRVDLPEIVAKYSDYAYITEEDPANEDAKEISEEVLENLVKFGGKGEIDLDREGIIISRIKAAQEAAKSGKKTLILVLGKGRENYMHRKTYDEVKSDACIAEELF